jgi:transglutaminase-like putative cysteine protease
MQPRSRTGVTCHRSELRITPTPDSHLVHDDYFGNRVHAFAIESLHRELTVTVDSDVTVTANAVAAGEHDAAWERVAEDVRGRATPTLFRAREFCFASPRVPIDGRYADYARQSFVGGRGVVEAARDLTERIHRDFRYDTAATDVHTPTEQSFELRAGVCQDFAHVQIACLRSLGLPARYVSGYLRTVPPEGKPRLVGADESHAWLSVFAGESLGWIDCDPTNACLTGNGHIPVCIGRDYGDVSPMRGVVIGGGRPTLKVSVDVAPTTFQAAAAVSR